jgi:hypothetical protein
MLQMFLPGFAEDEEVIQIFYHKGFFEWLQYIIHHPHECDLGISQAERHEQPLEGTFFRLEGCLPYISFFNRHLVVARL